MGEVKVEGGTLCGWLETVEGYKPETKEVVEAKAETKKAPAKKKAVAKK